MDNLGELDAATLEEKLKAADSYEDRAAIRKALRDLKKKQGLDVGGAKKRGSSQYNRFAGRPADTKVVSQSFVPTQSPIPSTSTPPPPVRTPTPPNLELEREKKEKEEERKRKEKDEKEREIRERKERERQKEEEEREREREKREREREEREKEREERRRQREIEREEQEREAKAKQERERERREKERQEREEERKREREEREREREREREERERERKEREREREEVEKEREEVEDEEEPEDTNEEDKKDEWLLVDKKAAEELENQAEMTLPQEDTTDGGFKNRPHPSSSAVKDETEFQKFKLRKTASGEGSKGGGGGGGASTKSAQVNTHDFGVKLKSRPPNEETPKSTPPKSSTPSWKSSATPPTARKEGGAPRTLADFQNLANRNKPTSTPPKTTPTQSSDKQTLIRSYVNAALEVRPPISSDHALYQLCSKPSNLCKLINKSVRNTVDLRALTKTPPPSASSEDKAEAMEENMMLVVESARAIGCSVTDDMERLLALGDKTTIDKLLMELIRSRVVHMPGMEDEPSSTFNDLTALMSKLGLTPQDEVDQGHEEEEEPVTWKEKDSQRLQEKIARDDRQEKQKNVSFSSSSSSWREDRNKTTPEIDLNKASLDAELSYEERAALRRAEREKKRREREGYATPK